MKNIISLFKPPSITDPPKKDKTELEEENERYFKKPIGKIGGDRAYIENNLNTIPDDAPPDRMYALGTEKTTDNVKVKKENKIDNKYLYMFLGVLGLILYISWR